MFGDFVLTGQGSMSARTNNITAQIYMKFTWTQKIKLLIFLLFTCLSVFGQEPPLNLAVRLQITSAVGSDPYTVTGIVSDDLSRFIADDIQVGDSLYVLDGSFVYVLGDYFYYFCCWPYNSICCK